MGSKNSIALANRKRAGWPITTVSLGRHRYCHHSASVVIASARDFLFAMRSFFDPMVSALVAAGFDDVTPGRSFLLRAEGV